MRSTIIAAALAAIVFGRYPAGAAGERETLRVALAVTPNTLNPVTHTTTTESFIISAVFDGLVYATPDGNIRPVLAEVVPTRQNGGISRDGRTITYRLRHGVRWHDGTLFTSRDVAFTQRAFVDQKIT